MSLPLHWPSDWNSGCLSPVDPSKKEIHKRLLQLFAPIVYFDPEEKFFPVDLVSAIQHSSLWRLDSQTKQKAHIERPVSKINPLVDLDGVSKLQFTTVTDGSKFFERPMGQETVKLPDPQIKAVEDKYKNGIIPAELTIYGTVCQARDVPNNHLFGENGPRDRDIVRALSEGLIINYYMYFPASKAHEFESEGDWSGISLLLRSAPNDLQDLNNPAKVEQFLPVITCYYHKAIPQDPWSKDVASQFVAGIEGFRRWKDVNLEPDSEINLDTHPVVYISCGRHNCYYEPTATHNVPLNAPWDSQILPEGIEFGDYKPGPADNTIIGEGGWPDVMGWLYIAFPPIMVFEACASACPGTHFDTSGLPPLVGPYQAGQDQANKGGFTAGSNTAGSTYPASSASKSRSKKLTLKLTYIDSADPAIASFWNYRGTWGGYSLWNPPVGPNSWCQYQGASRPSLAAWFLWNLFIDNIFGCGGNPSVTPTP